MLLNTENIALQSLQILYTFILRAEIAFFPHFTTFRSQTLQFYSF
jgi:hypothetical protein